MRKNRGILKEEGRNGKVGFIFPIGKDLKL